MHDRDTKRYLQKNFPKIDDSGIILPDGNPRATARGDALAADLNTG
jgi:hypothetical protein